MGFMDKAKKMAEQAAAQGKVLAEQAQTKLDETQTKFNEQSTAHQTPQADAVQYDKHGRPIAPDPTVPAAPGDTPAGARAHIRPSRVSTPHRVPPPGASSSHRSRMLSISLERLPAASMMVMLRATLPIPSIARMASR